MDSSKEDIREILELIKRFLPQFTASRDDLLKLNPSFVISFYKHYINEFTNNCQLLLDCNFDNVMDICPHNVDEEMFLFLFTQHILKQIGIAYFTICDFYRPSKRTRTTMKICLNFLFYIKENLPRSKDIVRNFSEQAEEIQARNERICTKKIEVSDSAYRIGLLKEQLEELNRKYEAETKIQIDLLGNGGPLDKETEQLEKELESLSNHVSSQEHNLNLLNEEIVVLSDQVIPDDYELCVKTLEQVQDRIKEDDHVISKNQETLEQKHKELEYLRGLNIQIQKIDMSTLDYIEEIDSLKHKVRNIESDQRNIIEQKKIFENMKQNIADIDKEFQEDIRQLESTANEKKKIIKSLDKKKQAEIIAQKELALQYQKLKQECDISKMESLKLQEEQDYLEEQCKQYYQRFITCLNSVTTTFNDTLLDALDTFETDN